MAITISGTFPFIGQRLISRLVEKTARLVEKTGTVGKNPLESKSVEECEFLKWHIDGGNY